MRCARYSCTMQTNPECWGAHYPGDGAAVPSRAGASTLELACRSASNAHTISWTCGFACCMRSQHCLVYQLIYLILSVIGCSARGVHAEHIRLFVGLSCHFVRKPGTHEQRPLFSKGHGVEEPHRPNPAHAQSANSSVGTVPSGHGVKNSVPLLSQRTYVPTPLSQRTYVR